MSLFNLEILKTLKARMNYHTARQKLLAQNVANSEVLGYKAKDLKSFASYIDNKGAPQGVNGTQTAASGMYVTNAKHIGAAGKASGFEGQNMEGYEVTPSNNNATLEEQMMLLAENQMDHRAAITLYEKSMSLLKTAIRRG